MLTKIFNRNVQGFNSFVSFSFPLLLIFDDGFVYYIISIIIIVHNVNLRHVCLVRSFVLLSLRAGNNKSPGVSKSLFLFL